MDINGVQNFRSISKFAPSPHIPSISKTRVDEYDPGPGGAQRAVRPGAAGRAHPSACSLRAHPRAQRQVPASPAGRSACPERLRSCCLLLALLSGDAAAGRGSGCRGLQRTQILQRALCPAPRLTRTLAEVTHPLRHDLSSRRGSSQQRTCHMPALTPAICIMADDDTGTSSRSRARTAPARAID